MKHTMLVQVGWLVAVVVSGAVGGPGTAHASGLDSPEKELSLHRTILYMPADQAVHYIHDVYFNLEFGCF